MHIINHLISESILHRFKKFNFNYKKTLGLSESQFIKHFIFECSINFEFKIL